MSTITVHEDSVEYIYLPFTSDVTVGGLSAGQVAFSTGATLPDSPTWISADIVEDEPDTGTNALRILFGTDWQPAAGNYRWFARVTDSPEVPLERGPNRIRVTE